MKKVILKYRFPLIGSFIGLILGFAYYVYVGCESGTCRITSNPIYSSLYGAVFGYFLVDFAISLRKKRK